MATVSIRIQDDLKESLEPWLMATYGLTFIQWVQANIKKEFHQNREAIADLLTATISAKVEEGRA